MAHGDGTDAPHHLVGRRDHQGIEEHGDGVRVRTRILRIAIVLAVVLLAADVAMVGAVSQFYIGVWTTVARVAAIIGVATTVPLIGFLIAMERRVL